MPIRILAAAAVVVTDLDQGEHLDSWQPWFVSTGRPERHLSMGLTNGFVGLWRTGAWTSPPADNDALFRLEGDAR